MNKILNFNLIQENLILIFGVANLIFFFEIKNIKNFFSKLYFTFINK